MEIESKSIVLSPQKADFPASTIPFKSNINHQIYYKLNTCLTCIKSDLANNEPAHNRGA